MWMRGYGGAWLDGRVTPLSRPTHAPEPIRAVYHVMWLQALLMAHPGTLFGRGAPALRDPEGSARRGSRGFLAYQVMAIPRGELWHDPMQH